MPAACRFAWRPGVPGAATPPPARWLRVWRRHSRDPARDSHVDGSGRQRASHSTASRGIGRMARERSPGPNLAFGQALPHHLRCALTPECEYLSFQPQSPRHAPLTAQHSTHLPDARSVLQGRPVPARHASRLRPRGALAWRGAEGAGGSLVILAVGRPAHNSERVLTGINYCESTSYKSLKKPTRMYFSGKEDLTKHARRDPQHSWPRLSSCALLTTSPPH